MTLSFQPSLLDRPPADLDRSFATLTRLALDDASWIELAPGWVRGSDLLFEQLLRGLPWAQRSRWMYDRKVLEPRLTAYWERASSLPLDPPIVEEMRALLGARYGVTFDSAGFNLYRDGRDGVAWHRDRIERSIEEPLVALVSLGERRRFLLRPRGGGPSRAFLLGRGDLLVTGGKAQRAWEHAVPKVAGAGPRITIAFRSGLDRRAYGR